MSRQRVMWDVFCGLGGASAAFKAAGWKVVTVDIEPMFRPDILADAATLDLRGEAAPDFAWFSPPCVEFARRRFEPDLVPSLDLVRHCVRLRDELKPKLWALENVRLSVPFIKTVLGPHRIGVGPYFLWGNFPSFMPQPVKGKAGVRGPHWMRSAERAKIPYSLSSDIERAVSYLLNAQENGGRPAGRALDLPFELPTRPPLTSPASSPPSAAALEPAASAEDRR